MLSIIKKLKKFRFRDLTIRQQIITLIAVCSIIVYTVIVYLFVNFQVIVTEKSEEFFAQTSILIQENIKANYNTNKAFAESDLRFLELSHYYDYFNNSNEEISQIFENSLNDTVLQRIDLIGMAVFDYQGQVLSDSFMKEHSELSNMIIDNFLEQKNTDTYVSNIYFHDNIGSYYYRISPVLTADKSEVAAHIISIYSMDTVFSSLNSTAGTNVLLLRQSGKIIYCSNFDIIDSYANLSSNNKVITLNRKKYYKFSEEMFEEIELIMLVPKADLESDVRRMYPVSAIIFVFGILQLVIAGYIILNSITTPVNSIIKQLDNLSLRASEYSFIKTNRRNEIGIISEHINDMLREVQRSNASLIDVQKNLYEGQIAVKEAELSSLYSQINPHFLYNTLECIRSISLSYGASEIEKISVAMSKIFRYSIKSPDIVTISEELDSISSYMSIMDIRFPDYYKFYIDVASEVKHCAYLKMTLQPIVENCFKHGFVGKKKKGTLRISITLEDNTVITKITDNGVGIEAKKLAELNKYIMSDGQSSNEHIGIFNINKRLRLNWGSEYGLIVKSVAGSYTTVIIKTPFINN